MDNRGLDLDYRADLYVNQSMLRRLILHKIETWERMDIPTPRDQVFSLKGDPGNGKTWLLRYLAATKSSTVFLNLEQRKGVSTVREYMTQVKASMGDNWGRRVVLLLDEVPVERDEYINVVEDQVLRPHLVVHHSLFLMVPIRPRKVCWDTPELCSPEWFEMEPFQEKETAEQVRRLRNASRFAKTKQSGDDIARIQAGSCGLPLLNRLLLSFDRLEALNHYVEHCLLRVPPQQRGLVRSDLETTCLLDVLETNRIDKAIAAYWSCRGSPTLEKVTCLGVRNRLVDYGLTRDRGTDAHLILVPAVQNAVRECLQAQSPELYDCIAAAIQ